MIELVGINKKGRERLIGLLRKTGPTISVKEASAILGLPPVQTAQFMARWANQGWLVRVRRGLYAPVPLQARRPEDVVADPWIVAARVFVPGYIGGWSAAENWGLTEQIFRTVVVMTTQPWGPRKQRIQDTEFWPRKIPEQQLFGTRAVWREGVQIHLSDSTKTVIDMLDDPAVGGGARMVEDIFKVYLASPEKNLDRLLDYASRMKNGAVDKRLGYLLERSGIVEEKILSKVRARLTQGNAKLDPALPASRLVTRWRLWVPEDGGTSPA